ncbi:MAG: phenylalanine--tRNA ligase subunit beta [Myxococcales bacterium]|nr:phenylalanine--tRNA ligase subunit beta [Myxococcales bacterium]
MPCGAMKASYSWLRSLLPGLEASPREVAERLTRGGLEVEELHEYGVASPHVVVAEVRVVEPHPSRERLRLVTVARGGGVEQRVVCGAPNVPEPGRKVVLAPVGTHLPAAQMTLTPRAIGGIASEGMLCSDQELGLLSGSAKGDGILVFPADFDAAAGTSLARALPASHDFVFTIGVTPNRPDALGHIGLARELSALFELPFSPPEPDAPARVAGNVRIAELASVTIEDTSRCPHYGAAVVTGLRVGPSPLWLRYRLESLGVRSISNLVDVTNLVLLEFSQPMHAFDLDRLAAGRVVVRCARPGERLVTLDGVDRQLDEDDLLITDGERPLALAGVMGGAESEIGETTTRVLLECAYFTPRGIRRTSRRHALHTEASHRFERGCDPEGVPDVLAHAASLLTRVGGGAAVHGNILAGVSPAPRVVIEYRQARADSLLGLAIPLAEASTILARLGCETTRTHDGLSVVAPSGRPDLKREEDLIEEVMRVHGIDEVPATLRAVVPRVGRSTPTLADRARAVAVELGLSEALTFGFTSKEELLAIAAPEPCVMLKNPLTSDRRVMRTSLLPGLFAALRNARRHALADLRAFTVGSVFLPSESGPLPVERSSFAAVLAGERRSGLDKPVALDVYDAKGIAVALVERLTLREVTIARDDAPHLHPRAAGRLLIDGVVLGRFGALHPDAGLALDLEQECFVLELDLAVMAGLALEVPQFRALPQLPSVGRDLAFVVSQDLEAGLVLEAMKAAAGELCESVHLFDRFLGKGLPEDHQSLAFHLVFRDPKASSKPDEARTLTDREVDACTEVVARVVGERFGGVLRG